MKKLNNYIGFLGLYWGIVFHLICRMIFFSFKDVHNMHFKKVCTVEQLQLLLYVVIPTGISLYILFLNIKRKQRGHTEFGIKDMFGLIEIPEEETEAFVEATYPNIPSNLKNRKPKDIVLGKQREFYVCIPMQRDGFNCFGTGTPGAGKSVMIQNILLTQLHRTELRNTDSLPFNFFLIDVDGLIYKNIYPIFSEYDAVEDADIPIQVFEPSNRNSFGWDVYYLIRDHEDDDTLILKVTTDIAEALVEESGDNPFFSGNGRKIVGGVLIYGIYKHYDFVPTIQLLTRNNLDELLTKICKESEACGWTLVLDKLAGFVGKGGNESLQDIESTMKQSLEVFSYPDIEFALYTNQHKTSPAVLNDVNTNLILSIETSMLSTYQPIFRLVVMQMLSHVESSFKTTDERNTLLIVDEAARVGKIGGGAGISLEGTMAVARKYHTSILLFFQDLAQFNAIYGKDKAKVIQNLCEIKMFLSGSGDKDTVDYLDEIVGDYVAEKKNYQKNGFIGSADDVKYAEDRRPIITGKSLMTLRDKNEMILIYFGKYYRFKKIFFFKDKYLKKFYEQTKAAKDAVEKLQEEK